MITVYRPDGVAEQKDPIDARECIEHCGYTQEPPTLDAPDDKPKPERKPNAKPTGE